MQIIFYYIIFNFNKWLLLAQDFILNEKLKKKNNQIGEAY